MLTKANRSRVVLIVLPLLAWACIALARSQGTAAPLFRSADIGDASGDTGRSRGVAWADVNEDGIPDLFVSRWEGAGGFYVSQGRRLVRATSGPLASLVGVEGGAWVDLDNDDDLDLHVVSRTAGRAFTFRNDGGAVFTPIDAGILNLDGVSASMTCWADVDRDGDLDAFVVGYRESANRMLRNEGNFRFDTVSVPAEARSSGNARACAWGDLEADGLPDLYIAVAGRGHALLRNRGNWRFESVTTGHVVDHVGYGYGVSWIDFDEDDDLDLFVAHFDRRNALYRNDGGGVLDLVNGDPLVTDSGGASKGHVWGDYDLDRDLDLYVANGTPAPGMQNWLYLNDGSGSFRRADGGSATTDADTSAGVAAADYDRDGDLDLYASSWGSTGTRNRFYENVTPRSSWISFQLHGRESNRFGVGARVRLLSTVGGVRRWSHRWVWTSTGYASQNPYELHFGLGGSSRADSVLVRWPSGRVDVFAGLEAARRWDLREGETTVRAR